MNNQFVVVVSMSYGRCPEICAVYGPFPDKVRADSYVAERRKHKGPMNDDLSFAVEPLESPLSST